MVFDQLIKGRIQGDLLTNTRHIVPRVRWELAGGPAPGVTADRTECPRVTKIAGPSLDAKGS